MRSHCEWSAALVRPSLCRVTSDERRQDVCLGSKLIGVIGGVSAVAACAVAPPSGPTVVALPPPGKSLAVFQQEDGQCRNYAASTTGDLHPGQVGTQTAVGSAAVGTYLGRRRVQPSVPRPEMLARVRLSAVQPALWVAPPSMQTMRRPMNTIYRHATTLPIPNACTRSAIRYRTCRLVGTATMVMRVRAILGTTGVGRASLEEGSSCSTATADSTTTSMMGIITASTASTQVGSTAEVVGAADIRPLPH